MPVMLFKGERRLSEVISRAYGPGLSAAEAKRAEAAMVAANPQLAKLREVPAGALLEIPRLPGARPVPQHDTPERRPEEVEATRTSLEEYRKRLGARLAAERDALEATAAILKSAEAKALARSYPESGPYLDRARAALKERAAGVDERAAFVKMLARIRSDLDELAKETG